MSAKAIPERFEADVLTLAGDGQTTRQIASWLAARGVKVSKSSVANLLKARRTERSEVAKTVVREKLAATLTPDLDIIGKHIDILDGKAIALAKAAKNVRLIPLWLATVEQLRKMIDMRLRYSGAGEPDDEGTGAGSLERISSRIAGLATRLRAAADAAGDRAEAG